MINGLKGVHLATNIPVEIPLNTKEMQLAMVKENEDVCWEYMCTSVLSRTGIQINGQIQLDYIYVNGVPREFH
tara:strand:- start:18520 stop:18738 length:219 start_codon:yes stop_codon:yes gene_type:complete